MFEAQTVVQLVSMVMFTDLTTRVLSIALWNVICAQIFYVSKHSAGSDWTRARDEQAYIEVSWQIRPHIFPSCIADPIKGF